MTLITKLTAEQEAYLPQFHDEYLRDGLNCEPADRPRAERAFARAYKTIGKEPVPVIWVDSPLTAQLAFAALENLKLAGAKDEDFKILDSLWSSLRSSLGSSLWSSLRSSLGSSLRSSLGSSLESSLGSSLGSSLRSSLGSSLGSSLESSLWSSLGSSLESSLWSSLGSSLESSLWSSLRSSLESSLWSSLESSLWSSLRSSLGSSLGSSLWSSLGSSYRTTVFWGQQDLFWISFYKFCQEIGATYQSEASEKLEIMHEIGLSCMWWYPCDGLIIACERPLSVSFDDRQRLHNDGGPAVAFRDGWKLYAVHGVMLDGWIIEQPELLNIKTIEAEPNTEIQRVMIERFGWERYAAECGAQIIDHDERYGTLFGRNGIAEFLKVVNGSPEPDGSFRNYILPVAPGCEPLPDDGSTELGDPQELTALNAVASTYGLKGREYAKVMEVRT